MMQEADSLRRELAEVRNKAEGLFYSSDKAMAEFGAMLPADEREFLMTEIADCRQIIDAGEDLAMVHDAVARLELAAQRIGEAIYAAAESGGDGGA